MLVIRRSVVSIVAVLSVLGVAQVSVAMPQRSGEARAPLRSGTLIGGLFYAGEARDCRDVPDCLAWVESGCDPHLTGRDPAWTASIENVADLADGRTRRAFEFRVVAGSIGWGGVVVQFWRRDCSDIDRSATRSRNWKNEPGGETGPTTLSGRTFTRLRIPSDAKWMTVATHDTFNIEWTLK